MASLGWLGRYNFCPVLGDVHYLTFLVGTACHRRLPAHKPLCRGRLMIKEAYHDDVSPQGRRIRLRVLRGAKSSVHG